MQSGMQMMDYQHPPMQMPYDQYEMAHKQELMEEEPPKPEPLETWFEIGTQLLFWFCFLIVAITRPTRHWLVFLASAVSWLWAVSGGLDSNKWTSKFGVLTFSFGVLASVIDTVLGGTSDFTRWLCILACATIALQYLFVVVADDGQTVSQLAIKYGKSEYGARVYWWFCVSSFLFWLSLMTLIMIELLNEGAARLQDKIKKEEGLLN